MQVGVIYSPSPYLTTATMATLEELAADKERELQQLREQAALANKENIKGKIQATFELFAVYLQPLEHYLRNVYIVWYFIIHHWHAVVIETQLAGEKSRLVQLRADFDYNLRLLSQRDEELARYEETFGSVKHVVNSLMAENSQLKVCMQYIM